MDNRRWNYGEEPAALSTKEQMEEFMFLGLRLTKGVDVSAFRENFGRMPKLSLLQHFPETRPLLGNQAVGRNVGRPGHGRGPGNTGNIR